MPRRAPATLADYLVVAICPALIMLMVGSLMWFLVKVFLNADFVVLWVMSFYVLGIVAVSRLAMEQGFARASLFGFALAGALALVLPPMAWPLLALIWWAAYKLTWDSTVVDEGQDVSGQGLLAQMGLDPAATTTSDAPPGTTTRPGEAEATTTTEAPPPLPWWDRILEPDRRPHAPGVWIVYFSLAALPLFGIGGWFVTDPVARAGAFSLLVIYVASGMGLLLATSFLGLRRYLRQRNLQMPMDMTTTWILVGTVMIVAMLIVATILPRPSREQSLSQLPVTATSFLRRASQFSVRQKGVQDDNKNAAQGEGKDGQTTEQSGGKGAKGGPPSDGSKSGGQQQSKAGSTGKGQQGKGSGDSEKSSTSGGDKSGSGGGDKSGKGGQSKSGGEKGDSSKGRSAEENSDRQASRDSQQKAQQGSNPAPQYDQTQQTPSQPDSSSGRPPFNPLSALNQLFGAGLRWLFYAALAVGLVVAAFVYREELLAAWQKLMDELRELRESWFGHKKAAAEAAIPTEVVAPPRTFASFRDPFHTGDASAMSWPQLVRYTFQALEAWASDRACPRPSGQTPHEFAQALSATEPQIAADVQFLAASYSQLAYAPRAAPGSSEQLRQLWANLDRLRSSPAAA